MAPFPEHTLFDDVAELLADLSNSQSRFVGQLRELRLHPELAHITSARQDASQRLSDAELPMAPTGIGSDRSDLDAVNDQESTVVPEQVDTEVPHSGGITVTALAARNDQGRFVASSSPLTEPRPRASGPRRARTLSRDYDFFSDLEEELRLLAQREGRPPTTAAPENS